MLTKEEILQVSDVETEVVDILKDANLWEDPKYWRNYGDTENNYSSAGNQANEAETAFKLLSTTGKSLLTEFLALSKNFLR